METSSSPLMSLPERENGHLINGHGLRIPTAESGLSDEAKIKLVSYHFAEIIKTLGLDLNEDGLKDTPRRVARMYVKDMFKGLNPVNQPSVSLCKNQSRHSKLIIEKNITLHSCCEHHFLPVIGKAHVGYISNGDIIGLSKLKRIVEYSAKRPQVQERLTEEIALSLTNALRTQDVAVMIDAMHLCVAMRGLNDTNNSTVTSYFGGKFQNEDVKTQFLLSIK